MNQLTYKPTNQLKRRFVNKSIGLSVCRLFGFSVNRLNRGFGIVEIIVAMAIFITIAITSVTVILQSFNINRLGNEETKANLYAQEGIEAVRSLKIRGWSNMDIGSTTCGATVTRGLSTGGGSWAFSGTSDTIGKYTRSVTIGNVCRDVSGNISDSGTTYDADVKKVTATIGWAFLGNRSDSIALTTYLSQFDKAIINGGPIMMAYSKTTSTPFYRTWNGSTWSTEGSANAVGGNINYIVLKTSRTRNEAILGTLDSNGNIYTQVWNGTSWSTPTLMAALTSANATTRSFDLDYEKSGDRAVIVYPAGTGNVDFAYRIWNGTSWSGASTVTTPPTTAIVRWMDVSPNPLTASNEISMIMMDNTAGVYGMVWNGTSWSNMSVASTWDTASIATEKVIDVAYEQTSGRAMFIWGDTVLTDQYYRIWNGSTLTGSTLLDIPASANVANWIELVSRPNSNELMYGVLDGSTHLNTRKWSGSSWDTATQHPEHDATVENHSSMVFDIVWETHSSNAGKAWLMYGDGATVTTKQWSGTAWGSGSALTGSDDTSFIRLKADPTSGAIFAGIYEDSSSSGGNRDIYETRLTSGGTTWSAENTIWGGATAGTPVFFRIDISTP